MIWLLPKSSLQSFINDINCNTCNDDQIEISNSMRIYELQVAIQRWDGEVIIPEPLRTFLWTLYVPAKTPCSSTVEVKPEVADNHGRYDLYICFVTRSSKLLINAL